MTGKTHLLIGEAITILLISQVSDLSPQQLAGTLAVGAVASLLPDIDTEHSTIKYAIKGGGRSKLVDSVISSRKRSIIEDIIYLLLSQAEIAIRLILVALIDITAMIFRHRGITHYLITAVTLSSIILIVSIVAGFSLIYTLVFFAAYTSHLLGDAMTVSGVTLFAPFSKKVIHLLPKRLRIRTKVRNFELKSKVASSYQRRRDATYKKPYRKYRK